MKSKVSLLALTGVVREGLFGDGDGEALASYRKGRRTLALKVILISLAVAGLLALQAGRVVAGNCITFLAVGEAAVHSTPDGPLMDMVGVWEFDNLLQVELGLSLNAVVFQDDHFVRFPLMGAAESGTLIGLDDGLDAGEIQALEAAGSPDPDAEVLTFRAHRLQLSLPPSFTPGSVSVVMYLVQDSQYQSAFLSNTLSTQYE